MNDFGLPTPPAPIPETPVITPPKKKFPFKIAAGVLMVLLLAAGVFVTDKITLQRQIIESQGKTAKMKPKDVKKKEDCGGASNGGWQVWRGGECKITGISGSTEDGGPDKDTEDPKAKQASTETACEKDTGYTWCEGTDTRGNSFGFCNTTADACYQKAIERGYSMSIGNCNAVTGATSVWYCQGENAKFGSGGCQEKDPLPGGAGWDGENKTIKGRFCGVIQVDGGGNFCSAKDLSGCGQGGAAVDVSPGPSPSPSPSASPGVSPSPSPSPSPSASCVDLTSNKTAPTMGDMVTFTCQGANFSSAAPVAQFRTSYNGGATFNTPASPKPINLTTNQATEQFTISQTGDWEVQCRVCTDSTTTTCTAWGLAN